MDALTARTGEVLSTTPERWRALAEGVERELLERRPAPDEWSAFECLEHILDTELTVFPIRIDAFLAGQDFASFDPDTAGFRPKPGSTPAEVAARFAEVRAMSLITLDTLVGSDLDRTAGHPELGQVTLREMLNEWAAHDLMHTVQAERALMQTFIVGSGKWRSYFVDHDVEALA